MGLGIAPWTRAWVKNVSRPSKTVLIGQLIFWCIPNKGQAERLLGEGYERSMDTWRLVDARVFFTFFFYSFLFGLFLFFFGAVANFFLPNRPIASTIRLVQIFFWTLCGISF